MSCSGTLDAAHSRRSAGAIGLERRCQPWLGTYVEVTADSAAAIDAAFAAVARVHLLMSAHDPASELSTVNQRAHRAPVALHPWAAGVLRRALFWAKLSDGAFDPTLGAVAQARGLIPRHAGQPEPDPEADWRDVRLHGDEVAFRRPVALDLGGIAKGFAVDRAADAMRQAGGREGLINAGGDIAGFGAQDWPVLVADPATRRPVARLPLRRQGLATSACRLDRDDHLPRRSPGLVSATVIAPTATDADALAKIVIADSPRAGPCLALVHAKALRIHADGRIDDLGADAS